MKEVSEVTDAELLEIAGIYGTPAYVFDIQAFRARIKEIKKIVGNKVHLCYSMKANPFLITEVPQEIEHLEVCSPGELDICIKSHVQGQKIIYSGVHKGEQDIADAVRAQAGIYTAESIHQAELLQAEAAKGGIRLPILLRLNAGSQFGMSREDLLYILSHMDQFQNLQIEGIHFFAGTQRKKLEQQEQELQMLKELFEQIHMQYGFKLNKLEYGPGLPVPYFTGENFSDTLRPIKELADVFKNVAAWAELTIEMGRFFCAECGYYLTKIVDQKKNEGISYSILDGGMNHVTYLGQIMGMKNPIIRHLKPKQEIIKNATQENWALCGSLCTTADVLTRQTPFTDLVCGDILAFCNIGAYSVTEGIYLFLSRTMPEILLYSMDESGQNKVSVAREAVETSVLNVAQHF